jgi:hypothetical protein
MSPRPRPAFALALATAMTGAAAGTATLPVAAGDEEPAEYCYTWALTDEEVEAGVTSEVDCYDEPLANRLSITLAIIYADANLTGSHADVLWSGASCNGANVVFGAGHPWDNRISSTDLQFCGYAKHYVNSNFTGSNQLMDGTTVNMNATLNNQTSSIEYAP